MTGPATTEGRIYDRGYRRYDGPRGGRAHAVRALGAASLRRALGLRRPWRYKLMPWVLLAAATVPAAVFVGVAYVTRDTPLEGFRIITYREYVGVSTALLLFVALTAPDLFCPDRRQRFLPLIFSRPLTGGDYVVAKVGAVAAILFAFAFLPQVVLFVGQMLVSDAALRYLADNAEVLWQVPLAVAALALYLALVGSAVASLTTRRIVAAVAFLGLLLFTSTVAAVIGGPDGEGSPAAALDLIALPLYVRDLIFLGRIDRASPLGGVAGGGALALACFVTVTTVAAVVLLARYRWAER